MGHNIFYKHGRLAQLGERLPYKQNVSSSILLSPTKEKQSGWIAFLLSFNWLFLSLAKL